MAASIANEMRTGIGGEESRAAYEKLLDDLALRLADAAHQVILLTSGPLSRRKSDWLLDQLSEELDQAARLVERLKRQP